MTGRGPSPAKCWRSPASPVGLSFAETLPANGYVRPESGVIEDWGRSTATAAKMLDSTRPRWTGVECRPSARTATDHPGRCAYSYGTEGRAGRVPGGVASLLPGWGRRRQRAARKESKTRTIKRTAPMARRARSHQGGLILQPDFVTFMVGWLAAGSGRFSRGAGGVAARLTIAAGAGCRSLA